MKFGSLEIDENDIKVLNSFLNSYKELNDTICDLQKQIDEISVKKKAATEKLELLEATESNFITFLKKKYFYEFTPNDLYKIITDYESSNMCYC